MTINKISSVVLVAFALLIPSSSQAYTAYNIQAQAVTPTSGLYSISFNLGNASEDMYVPMKTERTNTLDTTHKVIGFNFNSSEEGKPDAGEAGALILSTAEVSGNMYKVPAGEAHQFTILALLTLGENDSRAKYGLQITNLPFSIGNNEQGLNIHELSNYYTKEVGLEVHN